MSNIPRNTPIHCNRCDKAFLSPKAMTRGQFCGTKVARLKQFCKCPHCGQSDSHWVYARDLMPMFKGGFDARKRAQRKWMKEN